MDWARDLPDWPHADASRRIRHRPHDWHVQEWRRGPTLLLLHGAGASTHTWRGLVPRLSENHRVIALDLPARASPVQAASRASVLPPPPKISPPSAPTGTVSR